MTGYSRIVFGSGKKVHIGSDIWQYTACGRKFHDRDGEFGFRTAKVVPITCLSCRRSAPRHARYLDAEAQSQTKERDR